MTARQEFLRDVFTTAIEDYGTNPWRRVESYDPDEAQADILEIGDGDERKIHFVDTRTIARGIGWILDGTVPVADFYRTQIATANETNEAGGIDAYIADMILQAGILEQLVYG